MSDQSNVPRATHVCSAERANILDNWVRKFIHPPLRIVGEYISAGDTVVDIGCGPGYFTIPMAQLAGETGKVAAIDLQRMMLDRLSEKAEKLGLAQRILFHQCESNRLGLDIRADFILAFYMVHETPDALHFLTEVRGMLKPGGKLLVVEPPIHVSKKTFQRMLTFANEAGLRVLDYPKKKGGKAVLLGAL